MAERIFRCSSEAAFQFEAELPVFFKASGVPTSSFQTVKSLRCKVIV